MTGRTLDGIELELDAGDLVALEGPSATPTESLDTTTGGDIIDLLAGLAAEHGATVVLATNDAELVRRAPRRVAMRDGQLAPPVMLVSLAL
jgi:ABC-type lipoprotein export system ATPase subunit